MEIGNSKRKVHNRKRYENVPKNKQRTENMLPLILYIKAECHPHSFNRTHASKFIKSH